MRPLVLAACAVVLAGCAHPWNTVDLAPGTPREQVIARAGQPARVVPLAAGGQRLQYTLQPLGRYAFMVDLDPAGRVVSARQVLNELDFQRIEPGRWTRDDVEREFGPPAQIDHVASFTGDVLTYRWAERNEPMFYWVYVDPRGVVQRAHPGMEFINSPQDRD
ncbi:MAG TPA: hypothetical protein VFM98_02165 [Ramlibacter sp.]|uniref:hypothetical protein n=1 Tax=Ramlibacter sp. TaxID=1917967 RepID=UPI002D80CF31|nr:hypothetical protein [Ramlibacter sp.]HET8744380.1 hypothetical protein [Ramlibacter sp.]